MNPLIRTTWLGLMLLMPAARGAQRGDLVTVNVRDAELSSLLEGLSIQHRINLVAGDGVQGRVTINLYDVPLEQALEQILATQGLAYLRVGDFYRVVTIAERDRELQSEDVLETRVFTLDHLTGQEAQDLLTPLITPEGKLSMAGSGTTSEGGEGTADSGGARLVVLERRSRLEAITDTLRQLDVPPRQVLLEATILTINLGEENAFGVDFNVLGGIDFDAAGASSDLVGLSGYDVTGANLNNNLFSGQTFGFANDSPSEGLALGIVRNQVAAFLEALEETTNASILSNPKVVALDGEEAKIIVGGRLGYVTVTSTQTATLEEVQFLDTGTQLTFTPRIAQDGWIRMAVHPENSTGIVDPVSGVPSETTTEIDTSVMMRDGQTLVIGGLISERIQTTRSQIPLLGSLPVVGALFGRTSDSLERNELVVLLTPHILDPVQEERRAAEVQQRWDAVRRGHMDSLSPHLRPIKARSLHSDAEVLRVRGDLDGALGAVDRALALDPTSVPAALLREELLRALALKELPTDEQELSLRALKGLDLSAPGEPRTGEEERR